MMTRELSNLPFLVTRMAEKHMNSSLTPDHKTLLMNRLNHLLKTPDHPPYSAMIRKAIVELSEKEGSSEESISKVLEKEYKDLPVAHMTFLKHHLAKLCESGDITLTHGKKYVIAGANLSLKTTAISKESHKKKIFKWDSERQQRKSTKQLVQQRKPSLKAIVKIKKMPVKRMFKWDYERKQMQLKKLLARQRNQKKTEKVKVTEKHSEPNNVEENRSVEEEARESSQELVMVGPKNRKRLKGHVLLSEGLRRSKRLQNDFKQGNEVEKKPDLSVEPVLSEVLSELKCTQMHGSRNLRLKATVCSDTLLPVKKIFKWDWERKQRQLKKLLLAKESSNQMENDESKVTSEPNDVQENGSIQEEAKDFSQQLVIDVPMRRRAYLKENGPLSGTLRRSKRYQNDFRQENEVEKKSDFFIEPEELSEPKCIQMRSKRLGETEAEVVKFSCESQDQKVESDLSGIAELQEKVPENSDKKVEPDSSHMSENQEDVVVKKFEGIKTYYRRLRVRSKAVRASSTPNC